MQPHDVVLFLGGMVVGAAGLLVALFFWLAKPPKPEELDEEIAEL